MMSEKPVATAFHEGDEVILADGTYQGTEGVFIRLREDARWADITERNGSIQQPPGSVASASHQRRAGSAG
jgi:hypothetical protein